MKKTLSLILSTICIIAFVFFTTASCSKKPDPKPEMTTAIIKPSETTTAVSETEFKSNHETSTNPQNKNLSYSYIKENSTLYYPSSNSEWKYDVYQCNLEEYDFFVELTDYTGDLSEIIMPSTLEDFPVLGFNLKFDDDEEVLVKKVVISENINCIPGYAFSGFKNLKEIVIPETVKVIGEWAFYSCESLECVKLPDALEVIDVETFAFCKSLKEITLPTALTTIKREAFSYCVSLKQISFPESLKCIEEYAFED